VDPAKGSAEGWILHQDRTFRLDLPSGSAAVGGTSIGFSPAEAMAQDGDIFIRLDLWRKLLPADFTVDLPDLVVTIPPKEPFPCQSRLRREALRNRKGGAGAEEVLRVHTPYEAFTAPAVDINLASSV